jgi:hypothetical protein
MYFNYGGPASLNMSASGVARTNSGGTTDAPYSFSVASRATDSGPSNVIGQGLTYKLKEWWSVDTDYRYTRTDLNATGIFSSLFGLTAASGTSTNQWRIGTSQADLSMMLTPVSSLLVDVGIRYLKSDIENFDTGVSDPLQSRRIKTVWPTLKVSYQPKKNLSIRGDVQQQNFGSSYTRISPHISVGGRIVVRYKPKDNLTIENTTAIRNDKLLVSDYNSRIRSNATNISWMFNDRLQAFGGFSYDSLYASTFTSVVSAK